MSLTTILSAVAPNVSNEVLGQLIQAMDSHTIGATMRPLLDEAISVSGESMKSNVVPENPAARSALMGTIYDSFSTYRRRSTSALARSTGLTPDAVVGLVNDNEDFRVSQGRNSGNTYVSLRGL